MEERIFIVAMVMGAFAWLGQRWSKSQSLETPGKAGLWHGLFCGMCAYAVIWIAMMSFDGTPSYLAPMATAAAVAYGLWRGRSAGAKTEPRRRLLGDDQEWAETMFSSLLLAAALMYFVVQAFKIPSGSMRVTLLEGDHLFVNKFIYGLRVPYTGRRVMPLRPVYRGDVIVFNFPDDDPQAIHCGSIQYGRDFVKRVVGVPGDVIQVRDGRLFLNGVAQTDESYARYEPIMRQPESLRATHLTPQIYQELWQSHKLDRELQEVQRDYFGPVTVPPHSYFAMGDNRDHSCDSRYWGPVEERFLKGRAWILYWPPSRMKTVQ